VLKTWPYNTIGGIVVILCLVVINVVGIKEAARLNIILAVLDLATQILIMIIGMVLLFAPRLLIEQVDLWTAPTLRQFVYAISIGTIAYTGIETISNMAEEAAHPDRDVPRAINMVLVTVIVVYIGMSLVALSAMPVGSNVLRVDARTGYVIPVEVKPGKIDGTYVLASDPSKAAYLATEDVGTRTFMPPAKTRPTGPVFTQGGQEYTKLFGTPLGSNFIEDPVQGVVRFIPDSLAWLRGILGVWVGVLAATILIIATNAGLIGVSRLAYSLGQHRQVPPILGRVHPKRLTPYVSIIVFGVVACIIILPGSTALLADLYAFGAMISFTAAHVSVVVLRFKEPDLRRPFRTPLSIPIRGKSLPVLSVIGGLGTFTVWCVVVATHAEGRLVGLTWMAVGLAVYVVYRKAKGYSLTKTVEKVIVPATMQEDVDYHQMLVPIVGSRITDEMMVLACQLATEKQSSIDGLYVIEVPLNLPLDARLSNERAKADKILQAAGLIADQFKVRFTPHIVTARQAGKAIVDEAIDRRSEVIILGTGRKRRIGNLVFGRTADFVLDHAPCEVLLNLVPKDYPTEGSAVLESGPQAARPNVASPRQGKEGHQPPSDTK